MGAEKQANPRLQRKERAAFAEAAGGSPSCPWTRSGSRRQLGKVSTLAAHSLRTMGYLRAMALDGGLDAWAQAGYPVTTA